LSLPAGQVWVDVYAVVVSRGSGLACDIY